MAVFAVLSLLSLSSAFAETVTHELVFPASRRHFVRGEQFRLWAEVPAHQALTGSLRIFTDEGLIVTVREKLAASPQPATLSWQIDTQPLCPGRYYAEFVCAGQTSRGHFYVVRPQSSDFVLGIRSAPAGSVQADRYRSLQLNAAVIDDPAELDADALAQAGLGWIRHLGLKAGLSPADAQAVTTGKMYTKAAVQACPNAWGFRGIFIDSVPGYEGTESQIDLMNNFQAEADRQLAARAIALVGCNSIKPAAEALDRLKASPAKRLLMFCLKNVLREQKTKPELEPDVRAMLEKTPPDELAGVVRSFLQEKGLPIYSCTVRNPFADEHIVQAFETRFGLRIPKWWEGNANWEDWARYSKFRTDLWPQALEQWTAAARDVAPQLKVAMPAVGGPEDSVGDAADARVIQAGDSVLGPVEPLLLAALNRRGALWVEPQATDAQTLRSRTLAGIAAGATGVVYPQEAGQPLDDFYLSAQTAGLNAFLQKYGKFLTTLKPGQPKIAVLVSQNSYWYDLGTNPLENGGRSSYFERVLSAWTACTLAGYVPDFVQEPHDAEALAGYQLVLAPGLLKIADDTAATLKNFAGTVVVDEAGQVAIEGAAKLPFAFPDHFDFEQIRKTSQEIALRFKGFIAREVFDASGNAIVTQYGDANGGRYFWLINKSADDRCTVDVHLPEDCRAVYAVQDQQLLPPTPAPAENVATLEVSLGAGECRLMAALPQKIENVKLARPAVEKNRLLIEANLLDTDGEAITATVPASVVVLDDSGAERFRLNASFEQGTLHAEAPLAMNEDFGEWFVRVTELFSRRSQGTAFSVEPLDAVNVASAIGDVELFDRPQCERLLKAARVLTLVCGSGESRKAADALAKALQRLAIECTVVPQGKVVDGAPIAGDAIILGNAEDNELARHLQSQLLVPLTDVKALGSGRALVFWTASAFQPGTESISIWANDAEGYEQGVSALLEMCGSRKMQITRKCEVEALDQSPPRRPVVDVLSPVFAYDTDRPVSSLAVPSTGRFVLAGGSDGSVTAITSRGEEAWQVNGTSTVRSVFLPRRSNDSIICSRNSIKELAIVSTENWRFPLDGQSGVVSSSCHSDESGRTYIGTSAGNVIAIDETGNQLWEKTANGRITALAPVGKGVAVADEAGICLLNSEATTIWSDKQIRVTAVGTDSEGNVLTGDDFGNIDCRIPDGLIAWHREAGSAVLQFQSAADGKPIALTEGGAVLDLSDPKSIKEFGLNTNVIRCSASAEGWYAAGSLTGEIFVIADGRLCRFTIPDTRISAVAVAPEAELVVVGDWSGTVRAYRINDWKEIEFK